MNRVTSSFIKLHTGCSPGVCEEVKVWPLGRLQHSRICNTHITQPIWQYYKDRFLKVNSIWISLVCVQRFSLQYVQRWQFSGKNYHSLSTFRAIKLKRGDCTPDRRLEETAWSPLNHMNEDSPKWPWVPNDLESHNLTLTEAHNHRSGGCWLWVALCTHSGANQKWILRHCCFRT